MRALPIARGKNRYEDEREMQFHDNGIVEARFVVVHGCMMLLLLYRRRVGDSWQARSRIVSPRPFWHGPIRRLCSLTLQNARGKMSFHSVRAARESHHRRAAML